MWGRAVLRISLVLGLALTLMMAMRVYHVKEIKSHHGLPPDALSISILELPPRSCRIEIQASQPILLQLNYTPGLDPDSLRKNYSVFSVLTNSGIFYLRIPRRGLYLLILINMGTGLSLIHI